MPTTEAGPAAQISREERFASYVREAAGRAGYDIDSPRGGGKKAIAKAAGMSASSVGRMLAGQTMPSPPQLEKLAGALQVPLIDLLVLGGVVSERAKQDVAVAPAAAPAPGRPTSLSIEEAARALGIRSPDRIRMFKAMASTLVEQEQMDAEQTEKGA